MQSSLHSSECQDTPYFRSKKKIPLINYWENIVY